MMFKIAGYAIVFFGVALYIPLFIKQRNASDVIKAKDFYFAGRRITAPVLAASIFCSWLWTTSIIGAGEAGLRFGLSGGWAYSLGASIGFFFYIPLMVKIMAKRRGSLTLTQYIRTRYGGKTRNLFYFFSSAVVIYIVIEQAVGIGDVFSAFFGISFKLTSFIVVIFIAVVAAWGGMSFIIKMDLLLFFLIAVVFIIIGGMTIPHISWETMVRAMPVSGANPGMEIPSGESFKFLTTAGLRYTLAAVFIAAGQVYLDPGFFSKSLSAESPSVFLKGFFWGGFISWIPVSILCAFLFGLYPYLEGVDRALVVNHGVVEMLNTFYSTPVRVLFAVMVLLAGNATMAHCLVGMQSLFGLDVYEVGIAEGGTDRERILFSRTATLLLGLFCALIALALDGVSLLTLDLFSGIIFAAPCAAVIMAAFSDIGNDNDAVLSIVLGVVCGLVGLYSFQDSQAGWYYATLLSFLVPFLVFIPSALLKGSRL